MTKVKLCTILQKLIDTNTISLNTARWIERADETQVSKEIKELNEPNELAKIRKSRWNRLSKKTIEDDKVYINFSSFPSICSL